LSHDSSKGTSAAHSRLYALAQTLEAQLDTRQILARLDAHSWPELTRKSGLAPGPLRIEQQH